MPKYRPKPTTLWAKLFLATLAVGLLVGAYHASFSHIAVATTALVTVWLLAGQTEKKERDDRVLLASSRDDDSICAFSRSFDFRQIDTWVIRAVYEELQEELSSDGIPFPIRAEDDLVADLRIDPEDIDMSLAPAIAQRTGRSLEKSESNPYWGNVHTVADLVMCFSLQPKQPNSGLETDA